MQAGVYTYVYINIFVYKLWEEKGYRLVVTML